MTSWVGPGPVPGRVLESEIEEAVGVLTMLNDAIDRDLLVRAPHLKVVSQMAVGVDNIDLEACREMGIVVGHTPDVLTDTVADTAMAILSAVVRRIPEGVDEVREGRWGPWDPYHLAGGDLHHTTVGIVGMGRIGAAVARRARGYEMDVLYTSPRSRLDWAEAVGLDELLSRSDHVVITTALSEATMGMIGSRELALMKPSAFLVNVSRGPLIDTDSLVSALASGSIAGAGLDVTDPEPLPADHPLLAFPNCLVVPHIGSASVRTRDAMATRAVENLVAGLQGIQLPSAVPD